MEVYGGIYCYMDVYKRFESTWKCIEVYGGMWRYMKVYGCMSGYVEVYAVYAGIRGYQRDGGELRRRGN